MKKCLTILVLLLANSGCASERLYVTVVDDIGNPVSNAVVNVSFSSGHVVFGRGTTHCFKGMTGQDGNAIVSVCPLNQKILKIPRRHLIFAS